MMGSERALTKENMQHI